MSLLPGPPAHGMLCAVRRQRALPLAAGLIASALVAACSPTVSGAGHAASSSAGTDASTPDFQSRAPSTPAGTATVNGSTPPASAGKTVIPAPAQPLKTVTVDALDGQTYVVQIWADVKDDTCYDHAHGAPIVDFLIKHPCDGLDRVLGTTTVHGRPVGFAESSTGFRGTATDPYKWASKFSELEQQDGTGSIDDLLMDGYRLPSGPTAVPSPDAFNVVGQDEGVTVWDVWYLDEPTPANDKALITMTQDIFLQF